MQSIQPRESVHRTCEAFAALACACGLRAPGFFPALDPVFAALQLRARARESRDQSRYRIKSHLVE